MNFELIAHRGGVVSRKSEENTRGAIDAAIAAGYYGIEIDVRETSDHVPVLNHEPRLGRTGLGRSVTGPVIETHTADELARHADRIGRPGLLTIEDAAAVCSGTLTIMLEIKEPAPSEEFLARIRAALEEHGLTESLLLIGTAAGKRALSDVGLVSMRQKEFLSHIDRPDASATAALAGRFLFDHGNVLSPEICRRAIDSGMTVVPSVNRFHYRTANPRSGARADCEALINAGVIRFQIDSEFAEFFDGR